MKKSIGAWSKTFKAHTSEWREDDQCACSMPTGSKPKKWWLKTNGRTFQLWMAGGEKLPFKVIRHSWNPRPVTFV